jgi:hypothetical protein
MRRRLTSLIITLSSWGRWGSTLWRRWPRNVRGQSTPEAGGDADRRPPGARRTGHGLAIGGAVGLCGLWDRSVTT